MILGIIRKQPKRVYIDFDGVLHQYPEAIYKEKILRNYKPTEIVGVPVKGSLEWIREFVLRYCINGEYELNIFSGRSYSFGGRRAIKNWLYKNGLDSHILKHIKFPLIKKPLHVSIDDRAIQFNGKMPDIKEVANFKPWTYKKSDNYATQNTSCVSGNLSAIRGLTNKEIAYAELIINANGEILKDRYNICTKKDGTKLRIKVVK